jgi:hypothetical protein
MIAGTIEKNVGLVARISSHTCHATVVVLILTARIINVWYTCAHPPLSSHDAYTSFVNKEVTKWLEQRYNNDGVQCAL